MRTNGTHTRGPRPLSKELRIGQNSRAQWVVQDSGKRRGGLFINRHEALRFAFAEGADIEAAIIMVPGLLELDW